MSTHQQTAVEPPPAVHLLQLLPPEAYPDVPTSSLTTRFVASTQNKTRCPVFCTRFAPDSRRVLTGDSAGGISVWNTQDFGYMQYLQVGAAATPCACQRRAPVSTVPAVAVARPTSHSSRAWSGQGLTWCICQQHEGGVSPQSSVCVRVQPRHPACLPDCACTPPAQPHTRFSPQAMSPASLMAKRL